MDNRLIFKGKELNEVDNHVLGISGENEQELLIFSFEDGFVDGTGYLDVELPNGKKGCIENLEKDEKKECYKLTVKSGLLRYEGIVKMQLKIVQKTEVWKSIEFEMHVLEAINAVETIEEQYPTWSERMTIRVGELEEGLRQIGEKVEGIKVPTKLSELEDDSNFVEDENYVHTDNNFTSEDKERLDGLTDFRECDPTVPAWAKEPSKPMYTAGEVGALPVDTVLFSGDYEDLRNKPVVPSVEGLATEEFVKEMVSGVVLPEEVVISSVEPNWDSCKVWIDEGETEEFVTMDEFYDVVGNIESLLSEV